MLKLKRPLEGCNGFALDATGSPLVPGAQVLSVTANQKGMLNPVNDQEPVIAKGAIRQVFAGAFDGPALYWSDIDLGAGGSGGAIFGLDDQAAPAAGEDGRLTLKALAIASGLNGKNGQPYTGDMDKGNQSILIAANAVFVRSVTTMAEQIDDAAAKQVTSAKPRRHQTQLTRRASLRGRHHALAGDRRWR